MIWLLLMAALPMDLVGDPLPRYLTQERVDATLRAVEPALESCTGTEDATAPLQLDFHGDGRIGVVGTEEDGPVDLVSCLQKVIESHSAPSHDGEAQRVSTTVYIRNGSLFFSPNATLHQRKMSPLLLFVTEEARESVNSAINGAEPLNQ